uniref:M125R n=1 Tax=Parastrongyloides trichosuri TaxID=131310 RepID=A0A0N4ZFE6_PARTI
MNCCLITTVLFGIVVGLGVTFALCRLIDHLFIKIFSKFKRWYYFEDEESHVNMSSEVEGGRSECNDDNDIMRTISFDRTMLDFDVRKFDSSFSDMEYFSIDGDDCEYVNSFPLKYEKPLPKVSCTLSSTTFCGTFTEDDTTTHLPFNYIEKSPKYLL